MVKKIDMLQFTLNLFWLSPLTLLLHSALRTSKDLFQEQVTFAQIFTITNAFNALG